MSKNYMNKTFLRELFGKAMIFYGFTYFSLVLTMQYWNAWLPPLAASGLYFFTELMRMYKVNSTNQIMKMKKKAQVRFNFLI